MDASKPEAVRRETVAQIDLSPSVQIRVTFEQRNDGPLIDLRAYTKISISSGIFMSTARGFTLNLPAAQAVVEALQAALIMAATDHGFDDGRPCP